ncbi:MAG: xanthine dehydrogenase small subunit [Rubrivivax sp. SCN 70-15]|nr:MAG: xanthine dehydrogenase small subunit [Rubrivivax sp. SCN 70-15]
MNHRAIRFFHRGEIVEVADAPPTRTLLEWLREDRRCTGTKEGCAEGDCGACTVVVGELGADGALALEPVNACIRFLPTLDGKAVFTVEDLKQGDALHPVQQAMVDCHGSQCGFCTPGFVMSLWAGYERHRSAGTRPTRQQLADDLSGNLCRCTGYRPILDAGERMFELPAQPLDPAPIVAALRSMQSDPPLQLARGFHAPRTLAGLAALREARPDARLLAGATDLGLWVTKQLRELGELIYLGEVAELRRIECVDGALQIGAGASLESAWKALVGQWPALRDLWLRFASPPIRNAGTMGGNVANGSPIGDSAPVLIALDAQILLRRGEWLRSMALADFYVDYMKNRLERGEFVQGLRVPLNPAAQVRAYKISKRFDSDISAVCAGLAIELDGGLLSSARFAFGGMAATVRRASAAEAAVVGRPWNEASARAAAAALAQDFEPLSDMRASAGYRLRVAGNLLQRLWLETRADDPLPERALSVWSREANA